MNAQAPFSSLRRSKKARAAHGPNRVRLAPWHLYLVLIIPATILLNLSFINFHAPDDYDHLKRAYTIFHHPFRHVTPPGRSTGIFVDSGLETYIQNQIPIAKFQREISDEEVRAYAANGRTQWTGKPAFSETPGSLAYFPALYVPQAIALEAGRLSGASVERSVLWARFANSFAGIVLAALGLFLLPAGRSVALFLLLLPCTQIQFASNSADPVLYGIALVIVALSVRNEVVSRTKSSAIALGIFVAGAVRPPLAAFALTPALQAFRERRRTALALLVAACAAAALWVVTILPSLTDLRSGNVGATGPKLTHFVFAWPNLIGNSLNQQALLLYGGFVGHYAWGNAPIGYLGIPLPAWIYATALPILGLAAWEDLVTAATISPVVRLSLLASTACSVILTFLAMYLGCTKPDQTVIMGMQGRYFVTPLFAVGPAIAGLASARAKPTLELYYILVALWTAACTITMVGHSAQLYAVIR